MGAMASQTTDVSIVCSNVGSGADQRISNVKATRHRPVCGEFTGHRWIPAQKASNAENVSIWWRHHEITKYPSPLPTAYINHLNSQMYQSTRCKDLHPPYHVHKGTKTCCKSYRTQVFVCENFKEARDIDKPWLMFQWSILRETNLQYIECQISAIYNQFGHYLWMYSRMNY